MTGETPVAPNTRAAELSMERTKLGSSYWQRTRAPFCHRALETEIDASGHTPMRWSRDIDSPQRQQVAAVCFRILSTGIEFLLVRTRRGRWTFPKGGVQNGLTHAQSAALEAYEEAGVHGRIEEMAFARYALRKSREYEAGETQVLIQAHLCEVLRLGEPQELNRNPTWFASAKAKRRLAEGRTAENGAEFARVVERAIARIHRYPGRTALTNDPLFKAKFEASEIDVQRLLVQVGRSASIFTQGAKPRDPHNMELLEDLPRRAKILQLRPARSERR